MKSRTNRLFKTLMLVLALQAFLFEAGAEDIYLSPKGKDGNAGTEANPVRSLGAALELIKNMSDVKEVNIHMNTGVYPHSGSIEFSPESLNGKRPVIHIKSTGKNPAIIRGGSSIPVKLFSKSLDETSLKKLNPAAKGKVLVANLSGSELPGLFGKEGMYSMLAWNEYLMNLARWPNRGYNQIDKVIEKGPTTRWLKPGEEAAPYSKEDPNGGIFTMREEADMSLWAAEFATSGDVLVQGYLHNDWYYQQEQVGSIEGDKIELLRYTSYGIEAKEGMIPRRVRLVNLLAELDQPGEWYFDQQEQKLYIWPISKLNSKVNISLLGGAAMILVKDLPGFTLENLVFENGGELGIGIEGGSENLIAGCTFRNFLGRAITIEGGSLHSILSCDFYGLHTVASISGGDRTTLEPAGHLMSNCEISDCRRRGYGAVGLTGVGITFSNNLLHDMNGAVSFRGNDIIIELNEFYNMGWEMGDWNVAYIGADWTSYGCEVRHNFVHHLMETPGAYPVEGFRNDDLGAGVKFNGNVFYKSGRGAIAFSGAANTCSNNISIETPHLWSTHLFDWSTRLIQETTDSAYKERWQSLIPYDNGELRRGDKADYQWKAEQITGKMGWLYPPFSSAYPLMKKVLSEGRVWGPDYTEIKYNYCNNEDPKKAIYVFKGNVGNLSEYTQWEYPEKLDEESAFVDLEVLNLAFKPGFKTVEGFEPIPFEKIGLLKDAYRSNPPEKDEYRKQIRSQYEGIPSTGGTYVNEEVKKRFPLPAYLK